MREADSLKKERLERQAGAEMCQAQEKLGLAKSALPSEKLWLSSISKQIEFFLSFKKLRSFSVYLKIEVILNLP